MTDKQPEALQLAEILEAGSHQFNEEAADELRRLHAENEKLRMTLRVEESCSFRTQMQQYAAQRDELLEALARVEQADAARMAHKYAEDAIAKAGGAE